MRMKPLRDGRVTGGEIMDVIVRADKYVLLLLALDGVAVFSRKFLDLHLSFGRCVNVIVGKMAKVNHVLVRWARVCMFGGYHLPSFLEDDVALAPFPGLVGVVEGENESRGFLVRYTDKIEVFVDAFEGVGPDDKVVG